MPAIAGRLGDSSGDVGLYTRFFFSPELHKILILCNFLYWNFQPPILWYIYKKITDYHFYVIVVPLQFKAIFLLIHFFLQRFL